MFVLLLPNGKSNSVAKLHSLHSSKEDVRQYCLQHEIIWAQTRPYVEAWDRGKFGSRVPTGYRYWNLINDHWDYQLSETVNYQ